MFIVGKADGWYNRGMAELLKYKSTDRVFFKKGAQKTFLLQAVKRTGTSQSEFAKKIHVSPRTLTDWLREKYSLSYKTASLIEKISSQKMPPIIERRNQFWSAQKGAVKGGISSYAKHKFGNNEAKRLAQWKEWWQSEGKEKSLIIQPKQFRSPNKSPELAEFIGIMLGDGGMSTYQCNVTLDSVTDHAFSLYVETLIKKLFKVDARRYTKGTSRANNLSINRKGVVDFLISAGLKKGNKLKQGIEIPKWIFENKDYARACVRGLIDTDGCIIHETHRIKGKEYRYVRINFTSASALLTQSVLKILENENLEPKLRRNGNAVQLENKEKIWQYFKIIGTSNPKHLQRWQAVTGRDV